MVTVYECYSVRARKFGRTYQIMFCFEEIHLPLTIKDRVYWSGTNRTPSKNYLKNVHLKNIKNKALTTAYHICIYCV